MQMLRENTEQLQDSVQTVRHREEALGRYSFESSV